METKLSTNRIYNRMFANILSIFIILAIAFPVMGSAYAQEPVPWLIAFPENDAVEGWEWPEGAPVTLTIDNASDYQWSGIAEVTSWGDPRTYVRFEFWEDYDLQVGDMVTLTDEFGTSTTHEVQPLSITGVDMDTNIVTGTANVGAQLQVWVHEQSDPPVDVTIASDGTWQADLTDVFDITYGTGGRAWVIAEGGNATAVDWYVPNPHFTVFPEWEFFDGLDWPDGAIVSISVEGKSECYLERESWGGFFNGNFPEGCDVQTGDTITFDDGITNRWHVVRNLYVTDVDMDVNTVRGKADEGATVYVWPHDAWFEPLQATANDSGEWQVNLGDAGYTIREDSEGRSEIRDEMGNATASDWHVTHPRFTVFPEWEWFDGLDWPNEATVTITVAGKPECETTKESWGYFFNGNFGEGCDIVFGDTVTFTDGETTRTHTVRNLAITKVNQEDDTVKGIADAGAEVYVWPHATGQEQRVIANPKGRWNVDFTGIYDLATGDGGRAEIRDEIGNATAVDWNISNPRLMAFPAVDQIFGYYWPEGSIVNLNINGKHIAKATVQGAPWDPNDIMAFFDFGGLHDLAAGDVVMLSGHDMEINYTVQDLTVTEINEGANTVTGTADPGVEVMVYPFDYGDQPLHVTADDNGDWFANFEEAGVDLVPGMCGRSDIFDEFTNSTTVDWCIPWPPRIVVQITDDWFRAENFTPNAELTFWVYEAEGGQLLRHPENTWQLDDSGYVTVGMWELDEYINLVPGNYLVVSDGSITRELVLEAFTFEVFDLANGHLEGAAPAPFGRTVWIGIGLENEGWSMEVTTDGTGAWFADFDTPVPSNYQWVAAQIFDAEGDASELRPDHVVNLWVAAYTYDLPAGTLTHNGVYPYHFEFEWSVPEPGSWSGQEGEIVISKKAEVYDGYVLLRGPEELRGIGTPEGLVCEGVGEINPNQPMRFLIGWLPDYGMTYPEAQSHFGSITARAVWDDGMSAELMRHEIIPFSWDDLDSWFQYVCTFTE